MASGSNGENFVGGPLVDSFGDPIVRRRDFLRAMWYCTAVMPLMTLVISGSGFEVDLERGGYPR